MPFTKTPAVITLLHLLLLVPVLGGQTVADLGNQQLAALGLVDVTAAPFNADPTGVVDSSDALNAAIVFGRENHMVTFLPAGDYRVSKTIRMPGRVSGSANSSMDDYFCVLQGDTSDPQRRSRLVLAANAPGFNVRSPVPIVVHAYYPQASAGQYAYTTHYNQVIRSIDIVIGEGNSGAVGLRMQGAEGCLIEDVTVDATHGWTGVWGIPGSGGSTHKLTVIGGEIGINLWGYSDSGQNLSSGTQPGPMISQLRLINQTQVPLTTLTRGNVTIVGAEIRSDTALKAISLRRTDISQPWSNSLALVDAVVDLSGAGGARQLVEQTVTSGVKGRGYTLHNVYVRGVTTLDIASGLAADPAIWTHYRELAVAVPPVPYQTYNVTEPIMVDGQVIADTKLVDAAPGRAPDMDFVAYHGYGQVLPVANHPGVVNIVDFGADPTGVADSTSALRAAIAAGRDVLVPKGFFLLTDTVSLKTDTRLFGIHPLLSVIKGRDLPEARFAGLAEGAAPAPMVASPNDRNARTVISMLSIEAPRAVRQHRRDPVLAYALKWQSGRHSVIHNCHFSPYSQVSWRLEYCIEQDFKVTQETGNYVSGGLQFSNPGDPLGRILVETLGGSARLTMPSAAAGPQLRIARADSAAFSLASIELGKATFGDGIGFDVTVRGTRQDNSTVEQTVTFGPEWQDRDASSQLTLDWTNLKSVVLSAPKTFSVDNVVSSEGTADMEKRRPFNVTVDCGDQRLGFEHFPFAPVTHPQVLVTGHGGGRWYNNLHHGDIWAYPEFAFIEVRDTTEPLNIYHWHLQHVHSDSQAVFRNARFVSVFGFKSEHNSTFLSVYDSDHIRLFGWAGLADAAVGKGQFYFENTPNFLHAGLAEEPHFIMTTEVWSSCDNPLVVHNVSLFDGIQERFGGQSYGTPLLGRSILYKRGHPVSPADPLDYAEWTLAMGLEGADAQPGADPAGTGFPNLLQYALRMEADPWLGATVPVAIDREGMGWVARVRPPANRSDVAVTLRIADSPGSRAGPEHVLSPFPAQTEPDGSVLFPITFDPPSFCWLEAAFQQ